jgi:hypothetical protein
MSSGDRVFSVSDEYSDMGIYCVAGQKDWGAGYNRITQGLNDSLEHDHPLTGRSHAPHIYIADHCFHFISEATSYRWKKNRITAALRNAPDKPQDLRDHHMNAWQYFETSRPQSPTITIKEEIDPLKFLADARTKYNPLAESVQGGSWMSW